jgi:putative transcriptional regulator
VELTREYSPTQQIKLFAGYSGWSPGQLEDEMKREAWVTHPASLELVFETPSDQLWKKILSQKGWEYKLLSQMPEDLSAN